MFSNIDPTKESIFNEFIVKLNSDTAQAKRDFASKARNNNSLFNAIDVTKVHGKAVFLVKTKPNILPENLVQNLKAKFKEAIYVSSNYVIRTNASRDCSDQSGEAQCQSHDTNNDQWGLGRISYVDIPSDDPDRKYTWSSTNDGFGVTIYVVDSGVYTGHSEFSTINATTEYTAPLLRRAEGDEDINGHGTHVAGIAAGMTYGVAKRARIVSVKVQDGAGGGTSFRVLKGLQFILQDFMKLYERTGTRPKAVVNLSLGGPKDENIDQAIQQGSEMGIIYVAAAGNEAVDACDGSPSSSPDAITVGAIDNTDKVAWFSNYGKCVDILAPGVAIISAGTSDQHATLTLDGTSMAAPFVAGVIARLLSHNDEASDVTCIRAHLLDTAITDHMTTRLKRPMPDSILYAGCNTCFDSDKCSTHYSTYQVDDSGSSYFAPSYFIVYLPFAFLNMMVYL